MFGLDAGDYTSLADVSYPAAAAARTKADVLSIEVDTSGGTAGELGITDSLGLIASQPDSNARAFTSLAGVAYPPSS